MAWRSGLNEQLRLVVERKKRRTRFLRWTLSPAVGLGLATALMVVLNTPRHSATGGTVASSFESMIVAEHEQSVNVAQVSWVDRHTVEAAGNAEPKATAVEWSEVDTESL